MRAKAGVLPTPADGSSAEGVPAERVGHGAVARVRATRAPERSEAAAEAAAAARRTETVTRRATCLLTRQTAVSAASAFVHPALAASVPARLPHGKVSLARACAAGEMIMLKKCRSCSTCRRGANC